MPGPNIGSHMSIAGGLDLALERGAEIGCASIGMFCKSSGMWRAKPLAPEEVERFRKRRGELRMRHVVVHASYLVNLASPSPELLEKSRVGFRVELERSETIGADYLVVHPGSHMAVGLEHGIATLAASLDRIHAECPGFAVKILLEITAGAGSLVGDRFEELADVIRRVRDPGRMGVCLDTCHLFASGYDISTPEGWRAVMDECDDVVGLERVLAWHANDSKMPLGSHRDRHEHIGRGLIGKTAFRCLMTDRRFRSVPKILETEKEGNMDPVNLATLRKLEKLGPPAAKKRPARARRAR